jgi:multicomponent Na+:H+ antiporter subunit E
MEAVVGTLLDDGRLPHAPARPAASARPGRERLRTGARTALVLAILWAALNPGDWDSWIIGIPAVALGAGVALLLPPGRRWRLSPAGALRFAAYFARASVLGAVDVLRRAADPRLPVAPGFRTVTLQLPEGPARIVFANTISLLPGTLAADLRGDRLVVHLIDTGADLERELAALEARVRALFALEGDG